MVRQDATVCGVPQPGSSRAGRGTSCSLLLACGVHNSLASRRGGEQHSATDGAPVAEMMAWMVSSAASKAAQSLVDASPGGLNTSAGTDGGLLAPRRLPFTRTAALNDLVGCCVASLASARCFTPRPVYCRLCQLTRARKVHADACAAHDFTAIECTEFGSSFVRPTCLAWPAFVATR